MNQSMQPKRIIATFILLIIGGAMLLSACGGEAFINFTYDPTTGAGSGNVVIATEPPAEDTGGDTGGDAGTGSGNQGTNQIVLFGVVVALLIGTLAVVAASSRRRRVE